MYCPDGALLVCATTAIAASDLLATISSYLKQHFMKYYPVQCYKLPLALPAWSIATDWSKLKDCNSASI
jgi:hypothetical protein